MSSLEHREAQKQRQRLHGALQVAMPIAASANGHAAAAVVIARADARRIYRASQHMEV